MTFHHIGIACENISNMIKYLDILYDVEIFSDEIFDDRQEVNICIAVLNDGTKIELISGSKVARLVKKCQFLYHVCYMLEIKEDLSKKIKDFEMAGAKLISEPEQARVFNGRKVAFLMTKTGIIELLEYGEGKDRWD